MVRGPGRGEASAPARAAPATAPPAWAPTSTPRSASSSSTWGSPPPPSWSSVASSRSSPPTPISAPSPTSSSSIPSSPSTRPSASAASSRTESPPAPRQDRPRRHGHRLQGPAALARPRRGDQGTAEEDEREQGVRRPLLHGGQGGGEAGAPQHRPGDRRRLDPRRLPLLRDGVHRGQDPLRHHAA